jgi:hypothetical protein
MIGKRPLLGVLLASIIPAVLLFTSCGGDDSGSSGTGSGKIGASASKASGGGSPSSTSSGGGAKGTVEGSIVTTGDVEGTWTWKEGNAVSGANDLTLSTPDGRFGYIKVQGENGSVAFGSGAAPRGPYGSKVGGKVTLKGLSACSMVVDADLVGSPESAKVHVKGSITIKGTVLNEGGFEIKC